jgi:hypothetical protein
MKKHENIKKWDYNYKREYDCKLCHKPNGHSYICLDCRNLLQGVKKPVKDANGVIIKRIPKSCVDCGCTIVRRGLGAKRCRDCTTVNNQLRYSLYKKVEFIDYKINQLQNAKEQGFGSRRRLANLRLSRQRLVVRIHGTYLSSKHVKTISI